MKMKKIFSFLAKQKELFINIKDFLLTVVGFGLIINLMLFGIFNLTFSFVSFIAYGILYYFIDTELIKWIRKIKPPVR